MGMYTELTLSIELKRDTPKEVIETLEYMLEYNEDDFEPPNHKLFTESSRWDFMLRSWSYYFDGFSNSALKYDTIVDTYYLVVKCNLKNYDNEIESFLDWIKPYSRTNGFVGYSRYEEDEHPKLIYF